MRQAGCTGALVTSHSFTMKLQREQGVWIKATRGHATRLLFTAHLAGRLHGHSVTATTRLITHSGQSRRL